MTDKQVAVAALAGEGVAIAPGTRFSGSPSGGDHVRLTVGPVRDGFGELRGIMGGAGRPELRW